MAERRINVRVSQELFIELRQKLAQQDTSFQDVLMDCLTNWLRADLTVPPFAPEILGKSPYSQAVTDPLESSGPPPELSQINEKLERILQLLAGSHGENRTDQGTTGTTAFERALQPILAGMERIERSQAKVVRLRNKVVPRKSGRPRKVAG
jgi:hypothetical protein